MKFSLNAYLRTRFDYLREKKSKIDSCYRQILVFDSR